VIDLWGALLKRLPTTVLDSTSQYADYGGILNLLPIDRLESVMTVGEKQRPSAAEPPEGDDFDSVLAALTKGTEGMRTKSADELLGDALSGTGEGIEDLERLLAS